MTPAEVREIQLEVLSQFSRWCLERGLRFQLSFGSLLGAVRHQGFIPWDDDIDLAMPRADYEVFCREFVSSAPEWLSIGSFANTSDWPLAFAKVWSNQTVVAEHSHLSIRAGVGIDVFPIDEVKGAGILRFAQLLASRVGRGVETLASVRQRPGRAGGKAVLLGVLGPPIRRLGPARIARLRTCLARAGHGDHWAILVGPYEWSVPKASMATTEDITFENLKLPAPTDVSAVLTAMYGDYMTPPPTAAQVTHHAAKACWLC